MQRRNPYSLYNSSCARSALIIVLTTLALSACGSGDRPPVAAPVVQVKREQVPDDPTAKMARAVTVGNASVPINLKYEILSKPIVGSPVEIEVALIPTFGADSMTVGFVGSPGLTLSADAAQPIETVKAGQVERVKFTAQAQQESVYYVTVTATLYTAGSSSARNFAIPLIMSFPAPAAAETAPPTAAVTSTPKKS